MGRKSRAKKSDPARAERIRAMREKEAALRTNLDRLMKTGQDLADRAHYQKLSEERLTAGKALCDEFVASDRPMRELLAECLGENLRVDLDSQALETEIAQLRGKPDPHALDESLLQALPREQADALRFTVAFARSGPPRPETEIQKTYDRATAHLEHIRELYTKAKTISLEMAEIGREKVRRGWCTATNIDPLVDGLYKHYEEIESGIQGYATKLEEAVVGRGKALARRRDLTSTLDSLKKSPKP
jgi:hypothetical protein